jgi:hypothetical protein
MRAVGKTTVTVGFETEKPFADDGRSGVEMPCRGFDAVGKGVSGHLIAHCFLRGHFH